MTPAEPPDAPPELECALADSKTGRYSIRLYVTGATEKSARAIANLRAACEEHLAGRYDLEVIDVYQQPLLALDGRVLAAPTMIKSAPLPVRRPLGDLSDREKLYAALDIRTP